MFITYNKLQNIVIKKICISFFYAHQSELTFDTIKLEILSNTYLTERQLRVF